MVTYERETGDVLERFNETLNVVRNRSKMVPHTENHPIAVSTQWEQAQMWVTQTGTSYCSLRTWFWGFFIFCWHNQALISCASVAHIKFESTPVLLLRKLKTAFFASKTYLTAFLLRMSRKSYHLRFEDKILDQVSFNVYQDVGTQIIKDFQHGESELKRLSRWSIVTL